MPMTRSAAALGRRRGRRGGRPRHRTGRAAGASISRTMRVPVWAVAGQWTQCRRSPGRYGRTPRGSPTRASTRRASSPGRAVVDQADGVRGARCAGRRAAGGAASTITRLVHHNRPKGAAAATSTAQRSTPRVGAGTTLELAPPAAPGDRSGPGGSSGRRRSGRGHRHLDAPSAWPAVASAGRGDRPRSGPGARPAPGPTSPMTRTPASSAPSACTQPDPLLWATAAQAARVTTGPGDRPEGPPGPGEGLGGPAPGGAVGRSGSRGPGPGSRPGCTGVVRRHLGHHRRRPPPPTPRARSPGGGPGWARPSPGRRPGTRSRARRAGRGPGPSGPGRSRPGGWPRGAPVPPGGWPGPGPPRTRPPRAPRARPGWRRWPAPSASTVHTGRRSSRASRPPVLQGQLGLGLGVGVADAGERAKRSSWLSTSG